MKKMLFALLTGFAFSTIALYAQVDTEDIGSENITPKSEREGNGPFFLKFDADFIGQTNFRKCNKHQKLRFNTWEAEASMVFYYNPCYKEGANIALAYQGTRLDWRFNPFFNEKDVYWISLLIGAFTERVNDWLWRAQVSLNFDNIYHWNFRDYMNYDLLLWGRYNYCENVGLHVGFIAQTGMKIDRVYPIVGFDWEINCKWKLNVVYPVNLSIVYTFNPIWSLTVAGRVFDQRHRLKRNEFLSEGLWHYQNAGAEFGINYTPKPWLSANVHVGYSFGGHLTVADRHYHHRHRLRLNSAPYAGGEVSFNF